MAEWQYKQKEADSGMNRRVVVIGMGAITPIELNVKDFFEAVREGRHGFGLVSKFDSTE